MILFERTLFRRFEINLIYFLIVFLVLTATNTFSQVGIGTNTPAASAALEINSSSNNKGILIPRITAAQKDAISNPAEGLMIYQTSSPVGFYYYTGNSWRMMVTQIDINEKVDKITGKELSSNDFTTAEKTKLAAITGSNTGDQDLSALATTASVALKANTADLTSRLATKVDQVSGKDLSSNDYTTIEKTKLAAITGSNTGDQDLSALATTASVALKAPLASPVFTGTPSLPSGTTAITQGTADNSTKLATTAYADAAAAAALTSSGVADNSVSSAKIADGTISTADIANAAITNEKIAAVAASKITGVIPVSSGGTGETTIPGILSTLGFAGNNIAIGRDSGTPNQGVNMNTVSIGGGAGDTNQGQSAIAIGYVSGNANQGANALAIGSNTAQSNQGTQAVAIGYAAGQNSQGANAVAIGTFAGQSSQAANSIAINATGTSTPLNPANAGFYVDPIRSASNTSVLLYNTTTKEVTTLADISGNATNVTGTVAVANGGTGVSTLTGLVKGNGISALTAAVAGTDYQAPIQLGSTSLASGGTFTNLAGLNSVTSTSLNGDLTGNVTGNLLGNATSVTTNANLTGVVTSSGNATSIANGAIINSMLANGAVANLSGTNSGDNAVNSLYSGLVSNVVHTGEVTGSTTLTIANDAVTTVKIAAAAITDSKVADVAASKITGTLTVAKGGTGVTTLTANNVLLGNGTSAFQAVAPGTSGNVLTSNGTTWTSVAASSTGSLPATGNTKGEMLYWNGTAWVKVIAGTNGQTLTFINGAPRWTGSFSLPLNTVLSNTGRIWEDKNLGASQVANNSSNYNAYGSLYQWGRGSDGHQLINWTSTTNGNPVNTTTTTLSNTDVPANSNFIIMNLYPQDWRSSLNNSLWQGVNGTNNPCPSGYRLPTHAEWQAEMGTWSSQNASGALSSSLKLPTAGSRQYSNGGLDLTGVNGYYWSSTLSGERDVIYLTASVGSASFPSTARATGFSVRCIKD